MKVYMTSNEFKSATIVSMLASSAKAAPGSCHVGCAAWENLYLMCLRCSQYGIIFDSNPDNAAFMKATLRLVKRYPSRGKFISHFRSYLARTSIKISAKPPKSLTPIQQLDWYAGLPSSWLSPKTHYLYIRELALQEKIKCVTQDITDTKAFVAMLGGRPVDSLHLSNIPVFISNYARLGQQRAYFKTLLTIITASTFTLHSPASPTDPNPLIQRLEVGRLFIFEEALYWLESGDYRSIYPYIDVLDISKDTLKLTCENPDVRQTLYDRLAAACQMYKKEAK